MEKMKTYLQRIAALLAIIIGAMAVFAGGQVLLGKVPGYYVIDWLPVYNFTMGVVSIFITALLIWRNHRYAWLAAFVTLFFHMVVMVLLQTVYRQVVAPDSIRAMTIRLAVWLLIILLMLVRRRAVQKGVFLNEDHPVGASQQ